MEWNYLCLDCEHGAAFLMEATCLIVRNLLLMAWHSFECSAKMNQFACTDTITCLFTEMKRKSFSFSTVLYHDVLETLLLIRII